MGVRICPKCGGKVSTARNNCIHCGYVYPQTKICPDCEEEVDIHVKECPSCGYPFEVSKVETVAQTISEEMSAQKPQVLTQETPVPEKPSENENPAFAEPIGSDVVKCPYCKSETLRAIGVNYFMCTTCKGKFLNTCKASTNFVPVKQTQTEKPVEASISAPQTAMEEMPVQASAPATQTENGTKKKKVHKFKLGLKDIKSWSKTKKIIAATVACICLLAAVGGIIFGANYKIEDGVTYRKIDGNLYNKSCTELVKFRDKKAKSFTIPDSVTSIGSSAFSGCSSLTSVTIPDSVTSIGDYAFYNCSSLTSVTIPNSVESIGDDAFEDCSGLQYNVKDGLKYLGNSSNPYLYLASAKNTNITTATIDENCKFIGEYAFEYCSSLTSVVIGDSVTSIGDYAFSGCSNLTSVTIGDSVTSIGEDAFSWCSSLTSVTIGDSVTSICYWAFYNCSRLTSVYITDIAAWCGISGLDNLMYYATSNKSLYLNGELVTELVIPDSVTSIGNYAFYKCSSLTSVTIPNSVTSIGYKAFSGCSSLTSITIPNSVTSIGDDAFEDCSGLQYNVKDGLKYLGNSSNPYLYLADTETTSITTATIDNNCKFIGASAFRDCDGLTSVTIGDSLTSIGEYAFLYCHGLTSIVIPDSVTSIGASAFYSCNGLTSVVIGDSVTSIGDYAFSGCYNLTSVTIGNGVTSIGEYAFSDRSNLMRIKYRGSKSQWLAISKARDWIDGTGSYTITYNYTGE